MAHRGGSFGPENSLKTFRGAIENKVEGIEFDVSVDAVSTHCSPAGLDKQGWRSCGAPRWR